MKCRLQVPIANVRITNARGSRAFSDWSPGPISNVPSKNARGSRAFLKWSEGGGRAAYRTVPMSCPHQVPIANVPSTNARGSRAFLY